MGRENRSYYFHLLRRLASFRLAVRLLVAVLAATGLFAKQAHSQPPAAVKATGAKVESSEEAPKLGDQWVRLLEDKAGKPLAMQTAIVRYIPADEKEGAKPSRFVDLVGAVHIGDQSYYDALNKRFEEYDSVLYELVAPKGTVVQKGRGTSSAHPLGAVQNGMKNMLLVEHQLEQIDYTKPNFVHADFSPTEFSQKMASRDESFLTMFTKMMGASLAQQSQQAAQGQSTDAELFAAFFSKDRPRKLKIAMAKQFEGMETVMMGFAGPDGSTIITERNIRALDVLEKQLAEGKQRLAIFYGAGHLSDMHDRMEKRFKMVPISIEWLDAWDLKGK
ncbi:hypothetical protein [Adhaeretor mobilis]|uniref:TraB/GumN family protein n=1 Tax=Adhaeretor mobilis TaxID=1930276 RepID=A0A517MYN2_9BACT|nr:hypothetical protein [Adhaeretor mobilis]QDS99984.1 hypothetical protein HG15A2_33200 [Adhaeretor mobilis]